ncbi:MAG TPA: tetratricopeptide repeat protein [Candidatus Kapabacteria bacterium]|nr:tetratricopeptide repeat protein [Candidatus Kapabacteria bacterium]
MLKEGFVGRRRQLQTGLRALKQDIDKVGLLLLGTGGLGKSCLAGKICERFPDHTLIIIHGRLNAISIESALKDAFVASRDEKGKRILSQKIEMKDKLAHLCTSCFKEKNYLFLLDDFEQNLEGVDKGEPGPLLPETADLLKMLLHYLPFSGKMTQLVITSRYVFSLTEQKRDMVEACLEKVWLTSFLETEQLKKAQALKHILNYKEQSLKPQLLKAGHGNPRLMEWLDHLVGIMIETEIPQLLDAVKNKQEDFIRQHVIRELLQRGGKELELFLRWFSIYRRPVMLEGVGQVAEKAGLPGYKELLEVGMRLSLTEHDQVRQNYQVTPLLKEELLKGFANLKECHEAAFAYYKKVCEPRDSIDPILTEEWIYHALGCGEEDMASNQGSRLIYYLRERLAFQESRKLGEWILSEKIRDLSTGNDALLLNEIALTVDELGDHRQAILQFEKAYSLDLLVYGAAHLNVARDLNNLGTVLESSGNPKKAIGYFQKALAINKEMTGGVNLWVATNLNNLGEGWIALGNPQRAADYFQQALIIMKQVLGEVHPNIASILNNLGLVYNFLGKFINAIDYFEQAFSIDLAVYGEEHPKIATRLNNLGLGWYALGEYEKAFNYFQKGLNIWENAYGKLHTRVATALNNLATACTEIGEYNKAIDYYLQALSIDQSIFGDKHPNVSKTYNNLGSTWYNLEQYGKAIKCYRKALSLDRMMHGKKHPDIARDLNNLGEIWADLNKHDKAINHFQQALSILKDTLGEKHPNVANSLNNLGSVWADLGEYDKAIDYYYKALHIHQEIYGKKHPDIAICLTNIGSIYINLNQMEQAKKYFNKAYKICIKFFGQDHPTTKNVNGWLKKC